MLAPPEALAVSAVAVLVALCVLSVEFVAPPAPVVLAELVVLIVLTALVEADETVVELLRVVVCPLVLLAAVPMLATAAVSESGPLTAPEEASSLLHALAVSGIISTRRPQASELYGKAR